MKKLKTALSVLVASTVLASGAMADKKEASYRDYFSVGAAVSLVDNAAIVQGLGNEDLEFGLNLTRRMPSSKNLGFLLSCNFSLPEFVNTSIGFSIDNAVKNLELYLGMGIVLFKDDAYFGPHVGAKYHFFDWSVGPYLGVEFGSLLGLDKSGLYSTFDVGVRFDMQP